MTRSFDQGAARLEQVNAVRLLLEHGAEISKEDKAEFAVQHPKAVLIPRDEKCLTHDLPLLSKFLVEQSKKLSIARGCNSKISVSKVGLVPGMIVVYNCFFLAESLQAKSHQHAQLYEKEQK